LRGGTEGEACHDSSVFEGFENRFAIPGRATNASVCLAFVSAGSGVDGGGRHGDFGVVGRWIFGRRVIVAGWSVREGSLSVKLDYRVFEWVYVEKLCLVFDNLVGSKIPNRW
jgi:hypothetical protein